MSKVPFKLGSLLKSFILSFFLFYFDEKIGSFLPGINTFECQMI